MRGSGGLLLGCMLSCLLWQSRPALARMTARVSSRRRSSSFFKRWESLPSKPLQDAAAIPPKTQFATAGEHPEAFSDSSSVFARIAVAVITSDRTIKQGDSFLQTMRQNMALFENFVIYSDSITQFSNEGKRRPLIKPCCGNETHLGDSIAQSQYKLEKTLVDFFGMFPNALFFIYSDHDVWWNPPVMAAHLGPLMQRASEGKFIVSGAGGYPSWPQHLYCGQG